MSRVGIRRTLLLLVGAVTALSLFGSTAVASGPPVVTVGEVTQKKLNSATFNGTVDKNGATEVTYKFEYGKTKLYGSSTTAQSTSASGAVPISELVAGLESLTTYHVRVSATNSFGTTVSGDLIFEMLQQWKVEGKPLPETKYFKEYPQGPLYYTLTNPPPSFTVEGNIAGSPMKATCAASENETYWAGAHLGSFYPMAFVNCKMVINGEEIPTCAPKTPFVLNLNSVLAPPAGTKLELGSNCGWGESININAGFELGALSEAKTQNITMSAHLFPLVSKRVATISNMPWVLAGPYAGEKFGIS